MLTADPRLPDHRPLVIAHRSGNTIARAIEAHRLGADMIETDVWLHQGQLEIRHPNRVGPVMWERWKIHLGYKRLLLGDLLRETPDESLLFLDLKGDDMGLGPAILQELRRTAPDRLVAVCGRNYAQMDRLIDAPNVILFYSVGEIDEWRDAWPRLEAMRYPALSLRRALATPEVMTRLNDMGVTVVCWGVNTPEHLQALEQLGVRGATTDSPELIRMVNAARATR